MKLRDYQTAAVDACRQKYAAGARGVGLVCPTGGGKTVIGAEVIRLALEKGLRVGFLANRVELLNQAVAKLSAAGIDDVRLIQAENDNRSTSPVFVASIPTLVTERWQGQLPPADLLILDEVHHLRAPSWMRLAQEYSHAKLLGLTATPARGDGKGLRDAGLDCLVVAATVRQLTDARYIVPCHVYAPTKIMASRELAQDPVDAYEQRVCGQKAIVFCSTVDHARQVADSFNTRGHLAAWVSGESPDRTDIIAQFQDNAFRVLVNVAVLVEGFDDPPTSAAILAKRFTNVGSYLQAIGRTLRTYKGKAHSTVIDLCGSALVHGTPDLDREYSLDGKGISAARMSLRQCQECGGVFEQRPTCPYCGFATPPLTRKQAKALGLELHQVTDTTPRQTWLPKMTAKWPSICSACRQRIGVGQQIIYDKAAPTGQKTRHVGCFFGKSKSEAA